MPIDPRRQPITAEGRQVDRLASLERRLAAQERRSLNLVVQRRQYAEALAEVTTTSNALVDLGGPSITVEVPAEAFVVVNAVADLKVTTTTGETARLHLHEPTDMPSGQLITFSAATTYQRTTAGGAVGPLELGPSLTYAATPGTRTYSFRYAVIGATTGFFRNRSLWIEVR